MKKLLTLAIPCFLSVFSGAVNKPNKATYDNPPSAEHEVGKAPTDQVKGQLFYKKTINDNTTSSPREENYIVFFSKDRSMELHQTVAPYSTFKRNKDDEGGESIINLAEGPRQYFLLKDFKAKKLTLATNIMLKYYFVEDTISNFKWEITNEKKQLLKFNCTKATTSFRGRKYEAWFTEDVPLRNGPWKFCGLPGLIIKVNDIENIYNFELVSINFNAFDDSILQTPAVYLKDRPINHLDFIALYNKKLKELDIQSKASYFVDGNVSGSLKVSIPPLIEKF